MYWLYEILGSPLILIITGFWVLMLIDCISRRDQQWLWILIFLGPLGAVIYFIMVRPPLIPPQIVSIITGKPATANMIAELRAKIKRAPDAVLYLELGRLYIDSGMLPEAVDALQKSLEIEKDNLVAHLFLGKALFEQGKYQESLQHLEPALATKDRDHCVLTCQLVAQIYANLGEDKKALDYYKRLIDIYPLSEARFNYGMLLEKNNRIDEAKAQMEAIISEAEDLPAFSARKEKAWVGKARWFLTRHR